MKSYWDQSPTTNSEDIVTYALGPKKVVRDHSSWDSIMSEIIVSDALGVDRMDYLLRDSYYAGVAYGRFDQNRLIDTLRILPSLSSHSGHTEEFELGVEEGGLLSAEALLLARYFMFLQVYLHPVRRVYDIHLRDFFKEWLSGGVFSGSIEQLLSINDNHVNVALIEAAFDRGKAGHLPAKRIVMREHFKRLYARSDRDSDINPEAGKAIFDALCHEYGAEFFRHDRYRQGGRMPDFPVLMHNGDVESSLQVSNTLRQIPSISIDNVFADRELFEDARRWIDRNRRNIIAV